MKYYKHIYSFRREVLNKLNDMDDSDDPDEISAYLRNLTPRYIWFCTNLIYPENFNNKGNSLTPAQLILIYPNDWVEVSEEDFIKCNKEIL